MKELLHLLALHLIAAWRRWDLAHARQFQVSLERTIAYERTRARYLIEQAEIAERRANMAIVALRADKRITSETATQTR